MIHLTPQQLSSYMDGELNEVSTELVRRHMGTCEECTLKFAALEEQEEQLSQALVHEPGDDFFDRFAAEVERQLPASPGPKRGLSSPAGRAAAVREAARAAAREQSTSAPVPAAEAGAETVPERPAAATRPAPEAKPIVREPAAPTHVAPIPAPEMPDDADELDFDGDDAIAALTADLTSGEPDVTPTPSRARPPAPDAAPRRQEWKAPPPRQPARSAQRPVPRRPKIRRPAPAIPWYAAVILAAIAGAAGVVVSRTDPVSAWLDSHGLRNLIPNAAKPAATDSGLPADSPDQGAPARYEPESQPGKGAPSGNESSTGAVQPDDNSETSAEDDFEPEPQAAERFLSPSSRATEPGARDPFAGLSTAILAQVRAAQRSKAAADAQPSAARYDAAADEWERTIPLLRGSRQQSLSRLELASSRFRAWESEPTAGRAASAAVAIRAYLAFAPQGAPRDLVRNWLARVGH